VDNTKDSFNFNYISAQDSVNRLLKNPSWLSNIDFDGSCYHVTRLSIEIDNIAYELLFGLQAGDYPFITRDLFAITDFKKIIADKRCKQITIGKITDYIVYETSLKSSPDKKLMVSWRQKLDGKIIFDNQTIGIIIDKLKQDFPNIL